MKNELGINTLFAQLEEVVGSPDLDTVNITITQARPDGSGEDFVWRIASRSSESFAKAQNAFLKRSSNMGSIKQSLLFDNYQASVYWYASWGDKDKCRVAQDKSVKYTPDLESAPYISPKGDLKGNQIEKSNDAKLLFWLSCLEENFAPCGSTLWFPLSFSENGTNYCSSVFCVFNRFLKKSEIEIIAKLIQNHLIHIIVEVQSKFVLERYSYALLQSFNRHNPLICRNKDVDSQIIGLKNVIRSRLPLLIEGEPGTGKITVAKSIITNDCNIKKSTTDISVIDLGMPLTNIEHELEKCLETKNAIIFDDIQLATTQVQRLVLNILKRHSQIEEREMIIICISPSSTEALESGKLIYDLFARLVPFTIKLPSLNSQINNIIVKNHLSSEKMEIEKKKFVLEIVDVYLKQFKSLKIHHDFNYEDNNVKNDIASRLISENKWDGNYSELKQRVLRILLLNSK